MNKVYVLLASISEVFLHLGKHLLLTIHLCYAFFEFRFVNFSAAICIEHVEEWLELLLHHGEGKIKTLAPIESSASVEVSLPSELVPQSWSHGLQLVIGNVSISVSISGIKQWPDLSLDGCQGEVDNLTP